MKRFALLILAAATTVTACLKEQGTDVSVDASVSSGKGLVISAESVPLTKTDIDKGKSTWEYGDSIAVLYDGRIFIYKTLQSGNQVTFTCANGIDEYDESKGIIAYYPPVSLDEVIGISAEPEISFIGEEQINASKAPLVGTAEGSMSPDGVLQMSFKNICSIMELRINPEAVSDGIKTLRVEPASTTGYEGYLTFTGTVDLATLAITTATTGNVITLNLPENTSLDRPLTLKFPVGRFKSPSGLKLTVEGLDGKKMSRIVYATGVESYTEESGIYSVKHLAKPLYPFVLTVPEAVDLGLSVLWASCNLGATVPEDYGDYYAWGETETKSDYSWSTYKWCNGSESTLTKYNTNSSYGNVDNKKSLETGPDGDDVASKKLGGMWRMPTDAEWTEIRTKCAWTWTTRDGVYGMLVEASNGNSIFLPAVGYWEGTSLIGTGSYARYWSLSLNTDSPLSARILDFSSTEINKYGSGNRYYGRSVRPVYIDTSNIPVASVSVAPTSLLVEIGKTASLAATIRPANANNQTVTWSSSDPTIATVDQSGNVTGVKDGTTTIFATCGGLSVPCSVMVKPTMPSGQIDLGLSVKWASCNLGASSPEVYGDYYAWGEITTKTDYSWQAYKFRTSGDSWSNVQFSKYNTQSSYGPVDDITELQMSDDVAHTKLGEDWRMPMQTELHELIENCTHTWVSYNGKYGMAFFGKEPGSDSNWLFFPASGYINAQSSLVDSGVSGYYWSSSLRSEQPNDAFFTSFSTKDVGIYGRDGVRCSGRNVRPVYGKIPVSSVSIDSTTLELNEGASKTLTAKVLPSNATTPSLTWSSSKTSVATVNQSGKVTGVAKGTATITVKTADGGYTATCTVTVTKAVTGVSLNKTSLSLTTGKSETLIATISPSTASNKSVTWTSSNTSAATVNQSGTVKAIAKGTAKITVKTVDGGYTATCTVTVVNPVPTGAVDLGLSVYWAKSNLSTSGLCANPQDYGGYYAWGETAPKSSYNWSTYKWCNGSNTSLTRYCPSGKTSYWGGSGSPDNKTSFKDYNYADDAARKVLGSNWRMPTKTEWAELQNNCTWTWTTRDGVYGRLVTASNGNSIFLPAAGYRSNSSLSSAGSYGYYWTSSLDTGSPNSAWRAYFKSSAVSGGNVGRYMGFSVRPVSE